MSDTKTPITIKLYDIIDDMYSDQGPAYTAGFLTSVIARLFNEQLPESVKNEQLLKDLFGTFADKSLTTMESNRKVVEMDKTCYDRLKSVVVWYEQMPVDINSDSFNSKISDLINGLIPDIPDFNEDEHYMDGPEVTKDGELVFDVLSNSTADVVFEVVLVPESEE